MQYLELRLDNSEGTIKKGSVRAEPTPENAPRDAYEWKVVRAADDAVTVHTVVDGAVAEIGRAQWRADSLVERGPQNGTLGEHEWTMIQRVLRSNPTPKQPKLSKAQERAAAMARAEANQSKARAAERVAAAAAPPPSTKRSRWLNGPLALAGLAAAAAVVVFLMRGNGVPVWIALVLGAMAIGLAIYSLAGADSQCPNCDAWFHRKTLRREERGTEDSWKTESVKTPVYDTSRKVTGYTYTDRQVEITVRNYTEFYECTTCKHPWSVDYQSTSKKRG